MWCSRRVAIRASWWLDPDLKSTRRLGRVLLGTNGGGGWVHPEDLPGVAVRVVVTAPVHEAVILGVASGAAGGDGAVHQHVHRVTTVGAQTDDALLRLGRVGRLDWVEAVEKV